MKPTEDRPRNVQRWQSTAQLRASASAWTSFSTIEPSEASSPIEMTFIQFDVADPPFVLALVLSEAVLVLDWVLRRRVRDDRHRVRRAAGLTSADTDSSTSTGLRPEYEHDFFNARTAAVTGPPP